MLTLDHLALILALAPFSIGTSVFAWRAVTLHFDRLDRKEKEESLARFAAQSKAMNEETLEQLGRVKAAMLGGKPQLAEIVPLNPNRGGDAA